MNDKQKIRPQKKPNYNEDMEREIENISRLKKEAGDSSKPSLLLHACCGPCSSAVLERLAEIFDITIFYYNPNIHPKAEYERRLEELRKFLTVFPKSVENGVKLVVSDYNPEEYFEATGVRDEPSLQKEREKGERCRRCYEFRMRKSFEYAVEKGFDYFTTTLSISPHKDADKINAIGRNLESQTGEVGGAVQSKKSTVFLPSDFKKKGGYLRSTQLSEEFGLWRQDYCGCVFSFRDSEGKKTDVSST